MASMSGSNSPSPSIRSTPSPPPEPFSLVNPRPDLPPAIAAECLRRLVAHELQLVGFNSAEQPALEKLEGLCFQFIDTLLHRAHDLANLARRNTVNAKDVVQSSADLGVGAADELKLELTRAEGEATERPAPTIVYAKHRPAPPEPTLPSDDEASSHHSSDDEEEVEVTVPIPPVILGADGAPLPPLPQLPGDPVPGSTIKVKRKLPPHSSRRKIRRGEQLRAEWLPPLPAKHSYKQTPVFPATRVPPTVPPASTPTQQLPSSAALRHLSTLRSRLNDSQLVASSLRNLIRVTSARSTAARGGGGAGAIEGEGEGAVTAAARQEDEADVVDYEGEWYGSSSSSVGNAQGKRSVMRMRVGSGTGAGGEGAVELEGAWGMEKEGNGSGGKGFMQSSEWSDAGRVGGAGKRRRWRV